MGAKYSFILAGKAEDTVLYQIIFDSLSGLLTRQLASVKTYIVVNADEVLVEKDYSSFEEVSHWLELSQSSIVTLYPAESSRGCLMLYREGEFIVATLALESPRKPLTILRECWAELDICQTQFLKR